MASAHDGDFVRLRILLLAMAGWISRQQQDVIEYLIEENRVLEEQLRGRRLRLADDHRRRLTAKGKVLRRSVLAAVATILTLDTILRWQRQLIAGKSTYPAKRTGRPGVMKQVRMLWSRWPGRTPPGATVASREPSRTSATGPPASRSPRS